MPLQTIQYYEAGDLYNYLVDNRPIEGLDANVRYVDNRVTVVATSIAALSAAVGGDFSKVAVVGADGKLAPSLIPNLSAESIEDGASRVSMTFTERIKLASIDMNANVLRLFIGDGEAFDGDVEITGGRTVRVVRVPTSGSKKRIRIDSTFSPDSIHEHRYYRVITRLDGVVGTIPNEEEYIAGTLRLYKNGVMLGSTEFAEEVNPKTGKRNRFRLAPDVEVDGARHVIWAEYETRPRWDETRPDPAMLGIGRPRVHRWVRSTRLGVGDNVRQDDVQIETQDGVYSADGIWLLKVTDLAPIEPYELHTLYVNGVAYLYGIDWDYTTYMGDVWLRWRYSTAPEVIAWMQKDGAELASFDLQEDWELVLRYYTNWDA